MSPTPLTTATQRLFRRLLCRMHARIQQRRDRAALAGLGSYELRDIGVSHHAAVPLRPACPAPGDRPPHRTAAVSALACTRTATC